MRGTLGCQPRPLAAPSNSARSANADPKEEPQAAPGCFQLCRHPLPRRTRAQHWKRAASGTREELLHVHDFSSRYQGDTGSFAAGLTPVKSSIVFLTIFSIKLCRTPLQHASSRQPGSVMKPVSPICFRRAGKVSLVTRKALVSTAVAASFGIFADFCSVRRNDLGACDSKVQQTRLHKFLAAPPRVTALCSASARRGH